MLDLSTEYMGLKLKNPLIVASCSLVKSVDNIIRCQEAGAGAVVLKSLFEEQISHEAKHLLESSTADWHPESYDYIMNMQMEFSEIDYLNIVTEAKKSVSIPVIASINCSTAGGWLDYARKLEDAGADGLELNIALLPTSPKQIGRDIEEHYINILKAIKEKTSIPIAIKIGPYFSSIARIAAELSWNGASALVLFNRFYQFDIDIHSMKIRPGNRFSTSDEISLPLRWVAILAGRLGSDICGTTGVHTGEDVIKFLLAGSNAVQICSTLYLHGLNHIDTILQQISDWMHHNHFQSISAFHGLLCQKNSDTPVSYERLQYIKALVNIE